MYSMNKLMATYGMWAVMVSCAGNWVLGQEVGAPAPNQPATSTQQLAPVQPPTDTALPAGENPPSLTAGVPRKMAAGRLPRYFASLVDSRQREAIYQIQAAMATKIDALEKQLEELRQTEMREIEAVLNDTQRQQLQTLRATRLTGQRAVGT